MPFVLNVEHGLDRPAKRRRFTPPLNMARTNREEDTHRSWTRPISPQCQEDLESDNTSSSSRSEIRTSDREELIQCIKRGERPTWVPKPGLEALCAEVNAEIAIGSSRTDGLPSVHTVARKSMTEVESQDTHSKTKSLTSSKRDERPPSAFHAGDFRHVPKIEGQSSSHDPSVTRRSIPNLHSASPPPWIPSNPYANLNRTSSDFTTLHTGSAQSTRRSRAPSLGSSLSSSFVLRVPTSPLVHSTNNSSLDLSAENVANEDRFEADRNSRRRTMPPNAFTGFNISSPDFDPLDSNRPIHSLQKEASFPYQSHRSRRSLSSFTYQSGGSPQTPFSARARRLSSAAEISPRQRTSMVGSFEESILRGRMSTAPSKPLDFVAQIGVVGRGNCPSSLKCPAHVSVPFPAVFYNYPSISGPRTISDDSPSPYVGTIDIENSLKPYEEPSKRKRQPEINDPEVMIARITGPENTSIGKAIARDAEAKEKKKRASKAPSGGAYRIPQQGQLQVIIKNPNKTAVKLFLVPYDLEGMQPGTKTFVRQRSCSTGSIVDVPLTDGPNGATILDPLSSKQILRYLIHVKFCCTAKDRYFLYDNIQVVFANRVPEGKEKLQNEIQLPEPQFSPYKGGLRRSRRQSVSDSEAQNSPTRELMSAYSPTTDFAPRLQNSREIGRFSTTPIPFHLASKSTNNTAMDQVITERHKNLNLAAEESGSTSMSSPERPQSPVAGFELPSTSARGSPILWAPSLSSSGPRSFSPIPAEAGDGLLSRKLRELSKQRLQTSPKDSDTDTI